MVNEFFEGTMDRMRQDQESTSRKKLPRRVLLLITSRTYRAQPFVAAAKRLKIDVVKAVNMQEQLADYWNFPLGLNYDDSDSAIASISEYAENQPIGAILSVDDRGTLLAAKASDALSLPHNRPEAALAARDKHVMRRLLQDCQIQAPVSKRFQFFKDTDSHTLSDLAKSISFPCVLKPLSLSGSRGVIRANNIEEFIDAGKQLKLILFSLNRNAESIPFLVEDYIPGKEVALEGIIDDGRLHVLALFDKPDPLDGPYFEETIYVTPSRLQKSVIDEIERSVALAAQALGLQQGPVHAELRINEYGPWLIEMAARSIGGLCSHTLRFAAESSLEELILRQAFGMEFVSYKRESLASGVMMLPIPEAGLLKRVDGCEDARAVPLVESVEITARLNYSLKPLPEGDSYLGFIFARGDTPEGVENALRKAHKRLSFTIAPELPMISIDI